MKGVNQLTVARLRSHISGAPSGVTKHRNTVSVIRSPFLSCSTVEGTEIRHPIYEHPGIRLMSPDHTVVYFRVATSVPPL